MYKIEIIEHNTNDTIILLDENYNELIKFETCSINQSIINKNIYTDGRPEEKKESKNMGYDRRRYIY